MLKLTFDSRDGAVAADRLNVTLAFPVMSGVLLITPVAG
jgi:hypothetical protein